MTADEVAKVYIDILPGLLRMLRGRYGMTREAAEDLAQNAVVGLLKREEVYLGMIRPEVEAWFRRHDAGKGKGLKWRVRDFNKSQQRARVRDTEWMVILQKNREGATSLMNGERLSLPRSVDFTDLVIAKVDAEKAPPPKPKRKYTRKAKDNAVKKTAILCT